MLYTPRQLLDEWLTRRGYQPLRSDTTVDVTTGTDVEAHCRRELADWLAATCASAPEALLPHREFGPADLVWSEGFIDGSAEAVLPDNVARVTEVVVKGWARPALPVDADTAMATLEANPFLLPGPRTPMAIISGRRLTVLPATGASTVAERVDYIPAASLADSLIDIHPALLSTMAAWPQTATTTP